MSDTVIAEKHTASPGGDAATISRSGEGKDNELKKHFRTAALLAAETSPATCGRFRSLAFNDQYFEVQYG